MQSANPTCSSDLRQSTFATNAASCVAAGIVAIVTTVINTRGPVSSLSSSGLSSIGPRGSLDSLNLHLGIKAWNYYDTRPLELLNKPMGDTFALVPIESSTLKISLESSGWDLLRVCPLLTDCLQKQFTKCLFTYKTIPKSVYSNFESDIDFAALGIGRLVDLSRLLGNYLYCCHDRNRDYSLTELKLSPSIEGWDNFIKKITISELIHSVHNDYLRRIFIDRYSNFLVFPKVDMFSTSDTDDSDSRVRVSDFAVKRAFKFLLSVYVLILQQFKSIDG